MQHNILAADVDRRDVVCGGGAVLFSALLATLLGGARPAIAQSLGGSVPTVDRLAVRVVVDSYQFAVAPSPKPDGFTVEHFGWGLSDQPPGATLISEFGLSMQAMSWRGDEVRNVLVDFGFTPTALVNNSTLLGIDAASLDALVLSHGHYDHFGGLVGFLAASRGKLRNQLPIYVGGEECFCSREWVGPPVPGNFGALDRQALVEAQLKLTFAAQPSVLADHAFTTGAIDLGSFEKVLSPSKMHIGIDHGMGCYPDAFTDEERAQGVIPDQFRHEIATAYNVKDRGLVVLTSCSHRGVVNAVQEAQAVSGVEKIHAVIGGFHLAPHKPDYVEETVLALKDLGAEAIVPLHCTGETFFEMAKKEMPTKLVRAYTGTRLTFGA